MRDRAVDRTRVQPRMSTRTSNAADAKDTRRTAQAGRAQAVVVLGMHRSGTSAFSGSIARLGVDFGDRLARPAKDNENRFGEHVEIVALHDKLLASLGASWDSEAPLPEGWLERDGSREIQASLASIVERDFGDRPLFGFKDPRISRLLPLWFPIFEQLKLDPCFVLMVRHPSEVSESLLRQNGIVPSKAMLLWLRYTLEAEQATRGKVRSIVSYTQLLSDPATALTKAWQDLKLAERPPAAFQEEVRGFIEGSLPPHHGGDAERPSRDLTPPVVLQAYEALLDGADGAAAAERISRFAEQLDLFSALFQPRIDDLSQLPGREEFDEKAKHVAILQAEVAERTQQVAEARAAFDEKVAHILILQQQVQEKEQQVMEARAAFDEKVRHVQILQAEVDLNVRNVRETQRALSARDEEVVLLRKERDEKSRLAEHYQREAKEEARRVERVTLALQSSNDRLARTADELLDARWNALATRADALRQAEAHDNSGWAMHDLENRAQAAESERDRLREMLYGVQMDLEQQQAARQEKELKLKATAKELRFQQKQMARLREIVSRKLILPFGKAQRKIAQLTAVAQVDD